jgi:hypothetical protein
MNLILLAAAAVVGVGGASLPCHAVGIMPLRPAPAMEDHVINRGHFRHV